MSLSILTLSSYAYSERLSTIISDNSSAYILGEQDVWVCDCAMRVPITISGAATALMDYQVKLDVPALAGINPTFDNILFTSDDQLTTIPHWTQSAGATGSVWVNIPTIPIGGTTIYMYYDGCGSAGDPDQVFDYFNDFNSLVGATDLRTGGVQLDSFMGASVVTKVGDCDPAGAWFPLGFTTDNYVLVTRETRHVGPTGCNLNRYGIENPGFDGYNISRNGVSGTNFGFERRANEGGGGLISTGVNPAVPRDSYVVTELRRCSASDTNEAEMFDDSGTSLAATSGSINNHNYSGFDRITIRGGRDYHVDYMGVAKFTCPDLTSTFGTPQTDGPEAICMDIMVSLDASGSITILPTDVDNNSDDNCDTTLDYALDNDTFTCADIGANVVVLTVTDDSGLISQCKAVVTVVDDIDPVITCPANITVPTDAGLCTAIVNYPAPTTSDNCAVSGVGLVGGLASGSSFPIGVSTVSYRVKDDAGNFMDCSFTITVTDGEDPTITCPSNITVAADPGSCEATSVNLGTPTIMDNCPGATVANDAPAIFQIGMTNVKWTVTDASGNVASCIQTVVVVDKEAPTITCPSDITDAADPGACEATGINLGTPVVADNCPGFTISNDAPMAFPVGMTTVTWTVTDIEGSTATCTQVITIVDKEKPTIACPPDIVVKANFGSCEAKGLDLGTPVTDDNCVRTKFTNDAPPSFPVGMTEVTWTVFDAAGNMSTCIQKITVVDTQPPQISCPPSVTVPVGADCTAPGMNLTGLMTADNCGIDTFFNDAPSSYPLGTTTVTWTVVDLAGNVRTCVQDIIALDDTPPMITCPADTIVFAGTDCTIGTINFEDPAEADNCAVSSVTNDAPASFSAGIHTVTWTVIDSAGNMASCEQMITVLDSIPPLVVCPSDTSK